jgi:hypothetical protein
MTTKVARHYNSANGVLYMDVRDHPKGHIPKAGGPSAARVAGRCDHPKGLTIEFEFRLRRITTKQSTDILTIYINIWGGWGGGVP